MEWGYCEHCNKEIPVVAGMLEVHHTMSGVTGARDECSNLEQIECRGSMRSPGVMPQGGDAERYQFHDSTPMAHERGLLDWVREHVDVQIYPHQEPYLGQIGHYGGINVEVDGVDISGHVTSIEIHDEEHTLTTEQLDTAIRNTSDRLVNFQGVSSAWEVSEALLSLQGAHLDCDALDLGFEASQFDRERLEYFTANMPETPTPLGAIDMGDGSYIYPDDPAEAFWLAGVHVDQPVYLESEYGEPDDIIDFISSNAPRIRNAPYRITQRDSRGTMLQPLNITHLLNHYQGRVGMRAVGDLAYLSFT